MKRWAVILVTAIATATVGLAVPAGAEPGDLDGAFGVCGFREVGTAIARVGASANRTVTVEIAEAGPITSSLIVRRFTDAGDPDATFGQGGQTTFSVFGEVLENGVIDIVEDAQGRLLIAVAPAIGEQLDRHVLGVVVRLGSGGTLDASFAGGIVALPRAVLALTPAPAGGAFVLGYRDLSGWRGLPFTIDDSGAVQSETFAPPVGAETEALLTGPVLMQDDRFLAVDRTLPGDAHIVRWNADGSRDATFTPIEVTEGVEARSTPRSLATTADGKLLSLWSIVESDSRRPAQVRQYLPAGTEDPAFGGGAPVEIPAALDETSDSRIRVGSTGTIQVVVDIENENYPRIVQLTASGGRDSSFGDDGVSDFAGWARRGIGWTDTSITVWTRFPAQDLGQIPVLTRMSRQPLKPGAALMLQWDGTAWPTRFRSDPGPECPYDTPYWEDIDVARGITTVTGKGGYVVDAFGGTHRFSIGLQHPRPARALNGPYWPGWDIVRGIASKPDGTGGYIVDAFGGVHTFRTGTAATPARIVGGPYWVGWDIVRGIALMPDGQRGYILDGYGGIHRFTTPGHSLPPALNHTSYWPGWDIARGISVLPDGTGGYMVDAFGGAHPFGVGTHAPPPGPGPGAPYAPGEDWVRGFTFVAPMPLTSSSIRGAASDPARATTGRDMVERTTRSPRAPVGP